MSDYAGRFSVEGKRALAPGAFKGLGAMIPVMLVEAWQKGVFIFGIAALERIVTKSVKFRGVNSTAPEITVPAGITISSPPMHWL